MPEKSNPVLTQYLFYARNLTDFYSQRFGNPLSIGFIGLQTVPDMPVFNFQWGNSHMLSIFWRACAIQQSLPFYIVIEYLLDNLKPKIISYLKRRIVMAAYFGPIESQTLKNEYFRQVLFTGKYAQLVVMCLQPGEEIGNEVHDKVDQFFRVEEGEASFVFNGNEKHTAKDGDAVIVPAGTYHNVINASKSSKLKLYTLYSPPNHPDKTVHKTKADADKAEAAEHQH
jgi:mannose-6-phosphate isomerase-like protein (cupin superfamily)